MASTATSKSGFRLHFLDGLRGLACFYVLLFHASKPNIPYPGELSPFLKFVSALVSRGHFSVVFFIVLSGFSIMLPIARNGTGQLNGGFVSYAKRRARRILPPYYVALVLSMGLILAYNVISRRQGMAPVVDDALSTGSVVSHFVLVHNWSFAWAYRINGPMWSVATEWQIYFVFAALVLPLWRRFEGLATLIPVWILSSAPFYLLPEDRNFYWACPWFLGSFVFGMWGAAVNFSESYRDSWLRNKAPWGLFTLACFVLTVVLVATGRADSWGFPPVDFLVSLFALCWINWCVRACALAPESQRPLLVRMLESKAMVALGGFSYSLYLVQHPVLRLAEKVVARFTHTHDANIALHLVVVVPIVVAVGWFFAELFEKPFTTGGLVWPAVRRRLGVAPSRSVNP